MGQTAAALTLVPCPLQATSLRAVAGNGGGRVLLWAGSGQGLGEGLQCTVHVWCRSRHPGHLMLLSPPPPPCLTSFINVPNCEASARSGGLWWLALPWAKMEALQPLVPCVTTQGLQASSALPRHTESQERGCTTFIVSQHLWFPSLPTPSQGKGMRLPSCPRAPAWPGSVLLATCGGMAASGAGETVGTTVLSPGRAWAPTQQELGPHPLNHPF